MVLSWCLVTVVYVEACVLFGLVCDIHIIGLDEYASRLRGQIGIPELFGEHDNLLDFISTTGRRFGSFIFGELIAITAIQFVVLLWYRGDIDYRNGANFAVS